MAGFLQELERSSGACAAVVAAVLCALPALGQVVSHAADSRAAAERTLVDKYCVTCHSARTKSGGLVLEKEDLGNVGARAALWEKVVRKLGTGAMPPQGAPRPDKTAFDGFVTWLETSLDRAAEAKPNAGRPVLNRLNRTQYANAIHDLLALDVDVTALLPPDDGSFGFDNVGTGLGVSPALVERYIGAAAKISRLGVGEPEISPSVETYRVRGDFSQNNHIEGMPLGTRGGTAIRHNFPLDAEYSIKVGLARNTLGNVIGLDSRNEQVEILLNGERIGLFDIDKKSAEALEVRIPIKAGPQMIGVDFAKTVFAPTDDVFEPFQRTIIDVVDARGLPHLDSVAIRGPYNSTGLGDTTSRRRIFTCRPAPGTDEVPCAKKILSAVARRAYRRPVSENDMETLLSFYQSGRNGADFDAGIKVALQRILSSPQFVFRFERDPASAAPNSPYRISDLELASRLSFFLWSSIPDEQLLNLATQNKLRDPAVFEQQVRRMLADARSDSLVTSFSGQWLYLRNLASAEPNIDLFPDFDDNLRQSFLRETQLFFGSVLHEDRSVLDLLNADYTFVNERLARHYGIPNIYGTHFRRVTLTDENRRGLLGKGSTLLVTSVADRTSPVARGKWILENIVGTPPNPPPPNVPPLKANAEGSKPLSVRERMEAHRANAVCASCHRILDPLGFALENYDAVGRWRLVSESGEKIDASGMLFNGSKVDSPASLRQALAGRPDVFLRTMTEKLLIYALGRGLEYYDMPAVRAIVHQAEPDNYKFSSLIMGIAKSTPFQMRNAPEREAVAVAPIARSR